MISRARLKKYREKTAKPKGWPWLHGRLAARELSTTGNLLRAAIEAGFLREGLHFQREPGVRNYSYNVMVLAPIWKRVCQQLTQRMRVGANRYDKRTRECREWD